MKRVAILGRGGAGKSTAAVHLGQITKLPVIELDKHFWRPSLAPMPPDAWTEVHILRAPDELRRFLSHIESTMS
jgi:adenylate kinase family enzyme